MILIEASAIATPLVAEPDAAFAGLHWLSQEVGKYLPRASVIVLFPREEAIAPWARLLRNRMDFVGLRPSTREDAQHVEPARTRQLWHVRSEGLARPEGHFHFDLKPDRVREFVVPLGELPPWETIAAAVIDYAATMAFPVGVYADEDRHQDFDSFGIAEDEEPF